MQTRSLLHIYTYPYLKIINVYSYSKDNTLTKRFYIIAA